jgi:hypothetical protein
MLQKELLVYCRVVPFVVFRESLVQSLQYSVRQAGWKRLLMVFINRFPFPCLRFGFGYFPRRVGLGLQVPQSGVDSCTHALVRGLMRDGY